MANAAVLNAIGITPYAFTPISGGEHAVARVYSFCRGLPAVERIHLFTDSPEAERFVRDLGRESDSPAVILHPGPWDVARLFGELTSAGEGCDDLFYCHADAPLLDAGIAERMYASHRRYFAEYTFADGYPQGMTPEILSVEVLPRMAALAAQVEGPIERSTIFSVLERDINSFDIETEISPKDVRLLRLGLFCDSRRNFRLTERVLAAGGADEESVLRIVTERQELLRTLPAYFEVQITEALAQVVSYSPEAKGGAPPLRLGREMAVDRFASLAQAVADFAGDATLSISLRGEPALHSRVEEIVRAALRHEGLSLLIETSGIGWRAEVLEAIARETPDRLTWIVDLDASNKELYEKLRGEGWEEAQATCERLIELFPGRVHVQAVRMKENEADLEGFYRYWKERIGKVIIQKYDWYCGYLPQKKVTDLSPLRREPCWHLKRDLPILVDGSVPMCREDLAGGYLLGNVFEETLADIWAKGERFYLRHVREDYPELCKGCDEYYTYNF